MTQIGAEVVEEHDALRHSWVGEHTTSAAILAVTASAIAVNTNNTCQLNLAILFWKSMTFTSWDVINKTYSAWL